MKWSYGVTAVLERLPNLLPRTLGSLRAAGFERPTLFLDGATFQEAADVEKKLGLDVVLRRKTMRTFGNWLSSLLELYIREPLADRYALFQDDMVTYKNLRLYLERCQQPPNSYFNLYTFPEYHAFFKPVGQTGRREMGWRKTNQRGLGAVGLVFTRPAVKALLASPIFLERLENTERGWRCIDGGVVVALGKQRIHEYVHNPSLVQHTGTYSSMGNGKHKLAEWWRGEEFDALQLLHER